MKSKATPTKKPRKASRYEKRKSCAPGKHEYAMAYNDGQNCINCGERAKLAIEYSIAEARELGLLDE